MSTLNPSSAPTIPSPPVDGLPGATSLTGHSTHVWSELGEQGRRSSELEQAAIDIAAGR